MKRVAVTEDNFLSKPRSKTELCAWAGVTSRFLETEMKAGRLRARRLSVKLIRFMPEDVRDWMDRALTSTAA